MYDLTKRSENYLRLRKGLKCEDLESEIVIDKSLDEADLPLVEIEVNKKRRKKQRAEMDNQMISPASSVRSSQRAPLPVT